MPHPALSKMIAPGQRRPGIMRGGIVQIMVTRACDQACYGCTQGSNLAGRPAMMTVEQFDQACASLEGYFGVVGVFGGNPCMHPQFGELCRIMRHRFSWMQRGLWTNDLLGNGPHARITFYPAHCNFNVHMDSGSAEEFRTEWPESITFIKGENEDSVHSSPWVSMTDLGVPEDDRWQKIAGCDINQHWSSIIGVVRGELRAFFCEVAYSMTALHEDNQDWAGTGRPMPDTGHDVIPGWWRRPMAEFEQQVNTCCHHCGIPMRRPGQRANHGEREEFSQTHAHMARTKIRGRTVKIVGTENDVVQIGARPDRPATQYLPRVTPGYKDQG